MLSSWFAGNKFAFRDVGTATADKLTIGPMALGERFSERIRA